MARPRAWPEVRVRTDRLHELQRRAKMASSALARPPSHAATPPGAAESRRSLAKTFEAYSRSLSETASRLDASNRLVMTAPPSDVSRRNRLLEEHMKHLLRGARDVTALEKQVSELKASPLAPALEGLGGPEGGRPEGTLDSRLDALRKGLLDRKAELDRESHRVNAARLTARIPGVLALTVERSPLLVGSAKLLVYRDNGPPVVTTPIDAAKAIWEKVAKKKLSTPRSLWLDTSALPEDKAFALTWSLRALASDQGVNVATFRVDGFSDECQRLAFEPGAALLAARDFGEVSVVPGFRAGVAGFQGQLQLEQTRVTVWSRVRAHVAEFFARFRDAQFAQLFAIRPHRGRTSVLDPGNPSLVELAAKLQSELAGSVNEGVILQLQHELRSITVTRSDTKAPREDAARTRRTRVARGAPAEAG
jgi:hypothetical protein